jgi:methylenetetrahydrofolate dehydrogenase (NADP+)/methenyltetrahydrofolate cyclohydrolase
LEKILSGKPLAKLIQSKIKSLIENERFQPKMLLIQIGEDPASSYYVQNINNIGNKLGCEVLNNIYPADFSQDDLLTVLDNANRDISINGIMLQKPLPSSFDELKIAETISPQKDIDCLNPINLGRIILEEDGLFPCTPLAVICTLKYYKIEVEGKHIVIIGRSSIVGKPLANMLLWKKPYANATVTVCHSRTKNLEELTRSADILIAALGKPAFVTEDMIQSDSILIDVGINQITDKEGRQLYVGDIDYNSCFDKALAITPVPGGIGSVTSSLLFLNLVKACFSAHHINKSIDDFLNYILLE